LKVLLIGGSQFVGRHLVEAAAARGEQVTVFKRGLTATRRPDGVESRRGDRRADLSALADDQWDALVDTCGCLPRDVARMAECLHGRVGRYVFISSVSVYADFTRANDERGALGRIDDTDTDLVDSRSYGPAEGAVRAGRDRPLWRPRVADLPRADRRPARSDAARDALLGRG
jgi:2'-hydroxyisoflavone reductase